MRLGSFKLLYIYYKSNNLRMAACQDRELSINNHFGELLIFCSKIPFDKLFSKKNHVFKFKRFLNFHKFAKI